MWEKELKAMKEAALLAEKEILKVYESPFEVEIKSDNSPVTMADKRADKIIRDFLSERFSDYGFLTEESKDTSERLSKECVFIVDPVDGTKEFVSHNGEFTTNIALSYKGEVVVGLINVPTEKKMAYAIKGEGAYREKRGEKPERIHVSNRIDPPFVALLSRSFSVEKEKALLERHKEEISSVLVLGAAMKFLAIAEGEAEMFYRFSGGTKEWDVAAGDIIVTEAGGYMIKPNGTRYTYNKKDVYNHEGYVLLNRLENRLD